MEPGLEEYYNRHSSSGCGLTASLLSVVTLAFGFTHFYQKHEITKEVSAYKSPYPLIVNDELQPHRLSYALRCKGFGDEELSDFVHERNKILATYGCPLVEEWECKEINPANKVYPDHSFSFSSQDALLPVTCSKPFAEKEIERRR